MSAEIDGTSKGLLAAFAAFTLGSGLATAGSGAYLLYRPPGTTFNYGDFNLFLASVVLIAVGSLLLITLLLGVVGALKDISNLRLVTLVLLFILLAVLAVVGAYAMFSVKTGRLNRSIQNEIKELNDNYWNSSHDLQTKADFVNKHYNCCGSYETYDPYKNYGPIPNSCCAAEGCNAEGGDKKYFPQGCGAVYGATKAMLVFYVGIMALIVAGVVLLALVFFAALTQRSRAGYASVSRGQMK